MDDTVGVGGDAMSCIATLLDDYRKCGAIVSKLAAGAASSDRGLRPALDEFGDSIDQAIDDISREKDRGLRRFGTAFEDGDQIAVDVLRQIAVEFQKTLLDKLTSLATDDGRVDVADWTDAADVCRDRAITVLLELRQRLLSQNTDGGRLSMSMESNVRSRSNSAAQLSNARLQPRSGSHRTEKELPRLPMELSASASVAPLSLMPPHERQSSPVERQTSGDEDTASGAAEASNEPTGRRKRHSSLLGFLNKHTRSASVSKDRSPRHGQVDRKPSYQGTSSGVACPVSDRTPSMSATGACSPSTSAMPQTASERRPSSTAATAYLDAPGMERERSHSSSYSVSVPTPTPENDYLGFCKAAWRLQNGDRKAMQKSKMFNDGWSQSAVHYLSCAHSKCAFAGHIDLDKIWSKVWTDESRGLKFRWSFLAKSHVMQQKVKDHQYAYQCLFCVFMGDQSPVYFGTDTYLEHVQQHRGQHLGEVVLYKAKCIGDRIAGDDEDFDVNLFPLTRDEQDGRRESQVLSDTLLEAARKPRDASISGKDSFLDTSEPWNAGLSNFHWGGEFERAELE